MDQVGPGLSRTAPALWSLGLGCFWESLYRVRRYKPTGRVGRSSMSGSRRQTKGPEGNGFLLGCGGGGGVEGRRGERSRTPTDSLSPRSQRPLHWTGRGWRRRWVIDTSGIRVTAVVGRFRVSSLNSTWAFLSPPHLLVRQTTCTVDAAKRDIGTNWSKSCGLSNRIYCRCCD